MSTEEVWSELTGRLRDSEAYRELLQRLGPVAHLPLPAAAWVCELVARDLERSLLVVVPREADALAWLEMVELCGGSGAFFSAPSLSPYQETEVSLPVRAQEAVALDRVLSGEVGTLVCTPRALFRRLPEPGEFNRALIEIGVGHEQPIEALVEHLSSYGYRRSDLVGEVGDFAVRGGVFDLFPPGEAGPVRLDLFGDTVESIRWFDVEDQRSRDHLEAIRVLPLSLFRAGPEEATRLAELLAIRLGEAAGMDANEKIEDLRQRGRFTGWEHYLPLLAADTVSLRDLAGPPLVVGVEREVLEAEISQHERRLAADFEARHSVQRLAVPPELLEQPATAVRDVVAGCELTIDDTVVDGSREVIDFESSTTDIFHRQLPRFPREIETAKARSERLLVVAPVEHWSRLEQWCERFPAGKVVSSWSQGSSSGVFACHRLVSWSLASNSSLLDWPRSARDPGGGLDRLSRVCETCGRAISSSTPITGSDSSWVCARSARRRACGSSFHHRWWSSGPKTAWERSR
jgi:transcription-repair coupling factor (superfamily II helicase)